MKHVQHFLFMNFSNFVLVRPAASSLHYTETESTFPQVFNVTLRQMLLVPYIYLPTSFTYRFGSVMMNYYRIRQLN